MAANLGPLLASKTASTEGGFAFAETDDYAMVAEGADRLICQRRAGACTLVRPAEDPLERQDRSTADPTRYRELVATLHGIERDHGRYERGAGPAWPEALRRGLQGDADAALDAAALLDDADVSVRSQGRGRYASSSTTRERRRSFDAPCDATKIRR